MSVCSERRQGRANTWSVSLRATPLATEPRCSHRGGNKRRRSNTGLQHSHTPGEKSSRRRRRRREREREVHLWETDEFGQRLPLFFSIQ